jgi:hypothetical protein
MKTLMNERQLKSLLKETIVEVIEDGIEFPNSDRPHSF